MCVVEHFSVVYERVTISDNLYVVAACMAGKFKIKKKQQQVSDEAEMSKGGRENETFPMCENKKNKTQSVFLCGRDQGSRRLFFTFCSPLSLFFKQLPSTFHFVSWFIFQRFPFAPSSTRSSSPSV